MTPLRRSIRVSIAALFVATYALLLAGTSFGLYTLLARYLRTEFDGRLQSTAFAAQQLFALERAQGESAHVAARRLVGDLLFSDQALVAFDSTRQVVAWSRRMPGAPVLDDLTPFAADRPRSIRLTYGDYRILHQPLGEGIDLYVGRDLTALQQDVGRLRLAFAVGLPVILLLGGIIGVWGSRRAVKPIVAVAQEAERIGSEVAAGAEHFAPLPPRSGKDEVATLTTALNRLITRLEAALKRERESAEAQRAVLADTAHELRTPVAILQSSAEVVLTAERSAEEYRHALEAMAQESRALGALVSDLLLVSRGDAQGPLHTSALMYLDDAVSLSLTRIRALPEAQDRQIRIGELEAASVRADEQLIERAVVALMHNALVHAPDSKIEVSTGVGDGAGGHEAWLSVRDWGPGIPSDQHDAIFTRFKRLDTARPGTGLGLAIVKLIVEGCGGRVEVQSSPGEGATFTLRMPAASA